MISQIRKQQLYIILLLLIFVFSITHPSIVVAEETVPAADPLPAENPISDPTSTSTENQAPQPAQTDNPVPEPVPDTSAPSITVTSIGLGSNGVLVKGFVSDNQAIDQPVTMKVIYPDGREDALNPVSGAWSFTTSVTEKLNKVKIRATDASNNTAEILAQRPYIKSITMNVYKYKQKVYTTDGTFTEEDNTANIDIMRLDDITRVSLNQTIVIELSDSISHNIVNPFVVYDTQQNPAPISNFKFDSPDNKIEFTLNNLRPGETYYLKFNSSLISTGLPNESTLLDDNGKNFYPIIKKFTTVTDVVKTNPINGYTMVGMGNLRNQPHGYYNNNVNNCNICHNTHVGTNNKLEAKDVADKYCMACHDGTSAKMELSDSDMKSSHEPESNAEHQTKSGSCTSCHNPHLSWSEDNPNLLKDHYMYQHNTDDQWEGNPVGEIDSSIQLCEACHGRYTYSYKERAEQAGAYKTLHYRKVNNAVGEISSTEKEIDGVKTQISKVEDYNLCFNCHNSEKQQQTNNVTKDILSYYINPNSKHFISALDGNPLNGQMPCSECHDTHGSKNILLLKDKLGHENQQSFTLTKIEDWTDQKKREFCLACHNGGTSIYGLKGKAIFDENGDPLNMTDPRAKSGHARASSEACSACHSTNNSFIEAAHSPTTIKTP
ncbi:hypothetical protein ABES02_10430 [Neobacillus pocheonensis]|uniref:cytochrome c3 family protein n=1 Tax=Neobacillus pocheonensis TaxID=363869 RepID=UPI003D2AAEF4